MHSQLPGVSETVWIEIWVLVRKHSYSANTAWLNNVFKYYLWCGSEFLLFQFLIGSVVVSLSCLRLLPSNKKPTFWNITSLQIRMIHHLLEISYQMFGFVNVSFHRFTASCKGLIRPLSFRGKINTDNISIMFFSLSTGWNYPKSKSNLASLAEGLGECYQLSLHKDSSSSSLTSWQLHMKQNEWNKENEQLWVKCMPLRLPEQKNVQFINLDF